MMAGADSIDDIDLLRHGGMDRLFAGVRAPSTLGTHLRAFTFGNVRQLDAVASRTLIAASRSTGVVDGIADSCWIDIDDTVKGVCGRSKQGAEFGYTGMRGLNAQIATITTPETAPVIPAARLRRGAKFPGHGSRRMIRDVITLARRCGVGADIGVRADSGYYSHDMIAAIKRTGAWFSVVARKNASVKRAIASIPQDAWTRIEYPQDIVDPDTGQLINAAEVAEIQYTAFASTNTPITARLIARQVPELNKDKLAGQDELFPLFRYHAVFTNSSQSLIDAEKTHRGHAIIEQVFADLKASALAHLPSRKFNANAAWLAFATIAFNLTRTLGTLAGGKLVKAETATIRRTLINIPARIARSARCIKIRLPENWLWATSWLRVWGQITTPRTD